VLLRSKIYPLYVSLFLTVLARAGAPPAGPTFNKDILPILQTRCQPCHRPGEIGPMPLITYEQTRPWAKAIVEAVKTAKMPPWFADKCCGQFSTDHSLKPEEIAAIDAWVAGGSLEGKKKDAPHPIKWTEDWKIDGPSVVVSLPRPFEVPANTKIDYQYVILPIDLAEDKWASAIEIHPSDRSIVHHAVLYLRTKESTWMRNVPRLTMYAPAPGSPMTPDELLQQAATDILAVYTPGSPAAIWPEGMGKKLPAGSDLVLQLHYTSKKTAASDRTSVGINFLKERPAHRVLTLQMQNRAIVIPPGAADYHASVSGIMPRDALLLSFFPHMHLRGSAFEYAILQPDGKIETLLRVKPYDFFWQQTYPLKTPRLLPKGTRLVWTGYFDNSANNPRNPDPKAEVRWGEQSWEEMMVGFFDVAVEANVDKVGFFSSPTP
jgi:Copper type II ascorbate-dependent monooxygenase, C-terminal domain